MNQQVLDIGDDYKALMDRDVEILIFPCPCEETDSKTSERPLPWGALRGSVDNIAADFDKPESGWQKRNFNHEEHEGPPSEIRHVKSTVNHSLSPLRVSVSSSAAGG